MQRLLIRIFLVGMYQKLRICEECSTWNTSEVTNMAGMFGNAKNFNQPIGNWNTSKVTTMASMFYYAHKFNQPIGNWNTSNVTNMQSTFH